MDVFGVFIVCQGEFHPKLAANLTLAYVNANVAVGSLEVLDTANLLTLRLGYGYVLCRFVQSKPHRKSSSIYLNGTKVSKASKPHHYDYCQLL